METFLATLKILFPSLTIEEAQLKQYRNIATKLLENHYTLDHIRLLFIKNAGSISALSHIVEIHNHLAQIDKIPHDRIVQALTAADAQRIGQITLLIPLLQLHKRLVDLGLDQHDYQRLINRLPQPHITKDLVQIIDIALTKFPPAQIKHALLLLANHGFEYLIQLQSHLLNQSIVARTPNRQAAQQHLCQPNNPAPAKATSARRKLDMGNSGSDQKSQGNSSNVSHPSPDPGAQTNAAAFNHNSTPQQTMVTNPLSTPGDSSHSDQRFKNPENANTMIGMTPPPVDNRSPLPRQGRSAFLASPPSDSSQALSSATPTNFRKNHLPLSPNTTFIHSFLTTPKA
jgi:hypothetical protein